MQALKMALSKCCTSAASRLRSRSAECRLLGCIMLTMLVTWHARDRWYNCHGEVEASWDCWQSSFDSARLRLSHVAPRESGKASQSTCACPLTFATLLNDTSDLVKLENVIGSLHKHNPACVLHVYSAVKLTKVRTLQLRYCNCVFQRTAKAIPLWRNVQLRGDWHDAAERIPISKLRLATVAASIAHLEASRNPSCAVGVVYLDPEVELRRGDLTRLADHLKETGDLRISQLPGLLTDCFDSRDNGVARIMRRRCVGLRSVACGPSTTAAARSARDLFGGNRRAVLGRPARYGDCHSFLSRMPLCLSRSHSPGPPGCCRMLGYA